MKTAYVITIGYMKLSFPDKDTAIMAFDMLNEAYFVEHSWKVNKSYNDKQVYPSLGTNQIYDKEEVKKEEAAQEAAEQ